MKTYFPDIIEKGREPEPAKYGSKRRDRYGRFIIKAPSWNPQTPMMLVIVASAGDPGLWEQDELPGPPWDHVSVSRHVVYSPHETDQYSFTPTWDEMCYVKDLFFEPEECVVQFHPPKSAHVNVHPHTLHLWRPTGQNIILPPQQCV